MEIISELLVWQNVLAIVIGVGLGIIVGAIPGLTSDLGIILCIPITYGMNSVTAILMLLAIYCGGTYGGSITAILINTPGTSANAATLFDGYPMTQKGEAHKALSMAITASTIGGLFSAVVLLFAAPQIAKVTLLFGPPEYLALAVFGLSVIAGVSNKNLLKGLIGVCLGIFISTIGMDSISGTARFTFDNIYMMRGIPLIIALMGLFAISEIMMKSSYNPKEDAASLKSYNIIKQKISKQEYKRCIRPITIGSIIGVIIGATPGTGGGLAAFIAYDQAKRTSRHPESYGQGEIEGVAVTEAANNGATGATMVPMLTLGVPGDGATAILLGAFMIHGMIPGPSLFREQGDILYAIMIGLLVINAAMFIMGKFFIKAYAQITKVPYELLAAVVLTFCSAGAYSTNNSIYDVYFIIIFGIFAWFLRRMDFQLAPVLLGIVLGPLAELNYRRSLVMSDGSLGIFVTRPISLVFLTISVLSFVVFFLKKVNKRKKAYA